MAHVVTVIFGKNNLLHQLRPTESLKSSRIREVGISKGNSWVSQLKIPACAGFCWLLFNLKNKMHWSGEDQLYSREESSAVTLSWAMFYGTALTGFLFLVPR